MFRSGLGKNYFLNETESRPQLQMATFITSWTCKSSVSSIEVRRISSCCRPATLIAMQVISRDQEENEPRCEEQTTGTIKEHEKANGETKNKNVTTLARKENSIQKIVSLSRQTYLFDETFSSSKNFRKQTCRGKNESLLRFSHSFFRWMQPSMLTGRRRSLLNDTSRLTRFFNNAISENLSGILDEKGAAALPETTKKTRLFTKRPLPNTSCSQGRTEGAKGGQCGGRWITGGAEKSQQCRKYFLQYITFSPERPQVRTWGRQTWFLPRAPPNLVTSLLAAHTTAKFEYNQ